MTHQKTDPRARRSISGNAGLEQLWSGRTVGPAPCRIKRRPAGGTDDRCEQGRRNHVEVGVPRIGRVLDPVEIGPPQPSGKYTPNTGDTPDLFAGLGGYGCSGE